MKKKKTVTFGGSLFVFENICIVPEWLLTRRDFNNEYQKHIQTQASKVLLICSK